MNKYIEKNFITDSAAVHLFLLLPFIIVVLFLENLKEKMPGILLMFFKHQHQALLIDLPIIFTE